MSDTIKSSIWERSSIVRLFRWLGTWRVIRRCLIVLAWILTLLALGYGVENWRGRRAWNKERQELEARGEQLDFAKFVPQPVPDEQNFAATPVIQSWFNREGSADGASVWKDNYRRAESMVFPGRSKNEKAQQRPLDLGAWSMAFNAVKAGNHEQKQQFRTKTVDRELRAQAAQTVLAELKSNEPVWAELRAASRRPYSRYPVIYDLDNPWGILLPHLDNIKAAVQRLELKACAELTAGRSETVLEDVRLMFRLVDSIKDEPCLISHLVRVACLRLTVQPIWEGLAEHRWSDNQLQELQSQLQSYRFVTDLKWPLRAERAAAVLTPDLIMRGKYHFSDIFGPSSELIDFSGRLIPRGWYYQEKVNYCRLHQLLMGETLAATGERISPRETAAASKNLKRELAGSAGRGKNFAAIVIHHRLIAALLLPSLDKTLRRSAVAQTLAHQATLACALERYRLAHGQFPDKLEALRPQFIAQLPSDPLNGAPFGFRRTDDGQFILSSVGWDAVDNGGTPGNTLFGDREGDWVWRSQ